MKAIINTARGTARDTLVLVDRPVPKPGAGEVLVRVHATGVNPSDVKVRAGAQGPMVAAEILPHNDGAGVIEAVGEDVSDRRIGERVWLYNVNRTEDGMGQGPNGTAAEYTSVPVGLAPPLPHGMSFAEGACFGVPAMTAHRAVFSGGSVRGKTLFVPGGAGSVGLLAVQMASAAGARVITTVSGDAKAALAREAGAGIIINYRTDDVGDRIVEEVGEKGVDRLVDVDFASHIGLTPRILKSNGEIAAYASASDMTPSIPYYPLMFNNTSIQLVLVYAMPEAAKQAAIRDIADFCRDGVLRPHIARTVSLDDTAAAHEAVEGGGMVGNVVVEIA